MEQVPHELVCAIGDQLPAGDLANFVLTSTTCRDLLEPILYRRHALSGDKTAIDKALESADPKEPESEAASLVLLNKVSRYCRLGPETLDECRPVKRLGRLDFSNDEKSEPDQCPSLSPLHVAAWKGLSRIAAWLLEQNASVDAPVSKSNATALCLAVSRGHEQTALILLANNANPNAQERNLHGLPIVIGLVCRNGLAAVVKQLLAPQYQNPGLQPTQLLRYHMEHGRSDTPRFVAVLLQHGAEVSEMMFGGFVERQKFLSAGVLLTSPRLFHHLTKTEATSMLQALLSYRHGAFGNHIEAIVRILRHLLGRGADPDLGRRLWPKWNEKVHHSALLKLLAPFLEAGLDVQPTAGQLERAGWPVGTSDLLGHISLYDGKLDIEETAAQLGIVRLLLRYGAAITNVTLGEALDPYRIGERHAGQGIWAAKMCRAILDHFNSMEEDFRVGNVAIVMDHLSTALYVGPKSMKPWSES